MSEETLKENTTNPVNPEEDSSVRKPDMESAIYKQQKELNYLYELFEKHPDIKTVNAFFGYLDYKMNIQLLHKHALHHLRQFGLV